MANAFGIDIVGYRNARGRFARWTEGGEFEAVQMERAKSLSTRIQEEARRLAPRSHEEPKGREHFADSLVAKATATGVGFEIRLETDQGQLREWLLHGTAPHEIRPRNASALHFFTQGGEVFARVVHHPGTKPSRWEETLQRFVEVNGRVEAGTIGARLAEGLAGKL